MPDDPDFGFDPPAFRPDAALVQIRRALRELKLSERGDGVELKGRRVVEWRVDGPAIEMRLARRPMATTPVWDVQVLKSAADQRKWLDEVKKRLERWQRED
jgi:hypothetical protein